jgi:murein DD-endopeptidase MepM/ murein hydrolase activator NlpD
MDPALPLVLDPPVAAQGSTVLVRLRAPGANQTVASLDPRTVPLHPLDGDRFAGPVPIPVDHPPGVYAIHATAIGPDGAPSSWSADLTVRASLFQTEAVTLTGETMALLDPVLRAEEQAYLDAIWSGPRPERFWSAGWSSPMTATLPSSLFGTTRLYYPGPVPGLHTGLDLRARRGVPVFAPAPGVVALAETLRARGNVLVLDHGWGVYSSYFHLDSMAVAKGESVPAGAPIGAVGATGMVTGPHLHWEVRVLGVPVSPAQWLRGFGASVP